MPKVGEKVFESQYKEWTLTANITRTNDEGFFARVSLMNGKEVKWQSEQADDNYETFAFGVWYDGPGLPVYWGDVDDDGKPEMLAPVPKGDLYPAFFRVFRWTGDEMLYLNKRALMRQPDGRFAWTLPGEETDEGEWIDSFAPDGQAQVVKLVGQDSTQKTVSVKPDDQGFLVLVGD